RKACKQRNKSHPIVQVLPISVIPKCDGRYASEDQPGADGVDTQKRSEDDGGNPERRCGEDKDAGKGLGGNPVVVRRFSLAVGVFFALLGARGWPRRY